MGRELDCVISNDRINKDCIFVPNIEGSIDLRSGGSDIFYKFINHLETIFDSKLINYDSYGNLSCVIDSDWYNNLDLSSELTLIPNLSHLSVPKYIRKFLIKAKENGNKLGYCFLTGRLYRLGALVGTEIDVIDYDIVDDCYEYLCPSGKDFMRAVDKLSSTYGISVWSSIYLCEDFDSYILNPSSKSNIDRTLLIENRSYNLSLLLSHCKNLYKSLWECDEYNCYYEYLLLHLSKGHSFIYSV